MKLEEVNRRILGRLSGKEKEDFEAGLKVLNMDNPSDREALRESARRAFPDYTEAQLDIFVAGEVKPTSEWNLK